MSTRMYSLTLWALLFSIGSVAAMGQNRCHGWKFSGKVLTIRPVLDRFVAVHPLAPDMEDPKVLAGDEEIRMTPESFLGVTVSKTPFGGTGEMGGSLKTLGKLLAAPAGKPGGSVPIAVETVADGVDAVSLKNSMGPGSRVFFVHLKKFQDGCPIPPMPVDPFTNQALVFHFCQCPTVANSVKCSFSCVQNCNACKELVEATE